MGCRPGKVGRLQNLRRPARVVSTLIGVLLLGLAFVLHELAGEHVVPAVGAGIVGLVLLLPLLTEFEVDVFGLRAKGTLRSREQRLEAACRQDARQVASFVNLVGVQADQVNSLVEEAIEDTCRLWRGPVVEELVGQLLVCRAAHLIRVSLRLGGPYRVLTPEHTDADRPEWTAFAELDPTDRLVVVMVEWLELDAGTVAGILDLDLGVVEQTLRWDAATPTGGPTP